MRVKLGTYTGNGSDSRSIRGVGFKPDLVVVKSANNNNAVFKTKEMAGDAAIGLREDAAIQTNYIQALEEDGFQVGTDSRVNSSGIVYYYLCVRADGMNDFATFSYTGNGSDGLAITGLGFQPDYVQVHSNSNIVGAQIFSTKSGEPRTAMMFAGDNRSDLYASLDSDGFTVNDGSGSGANLINVNATAHYGYAFKKVPGFLDVFSYTGNGSDNRDISVTGTTFQPGFVWIKGESSTSCVVRFKDHSGDSATAIDGQDGSNIIQGFNSTGFQVGTDGATNTNGNIYHVLAIKDNFSTATNICTRMCNDDGAQQATTGTNNISNTTHVFGTTASTNYTHVGFRFTDITVNQGATIHKATLRIYASSISASAGTFSILANDVDNAAALNTTNNDLSGRSYTAAVTRRIHDLSAGFIDLDVTSIVQTVINRGGWASGNALMLCLQSPWVGASATIATIDGTSNFPQLKIVHGGSSAGFSTFGSNTGSYTNPTNATSDNASYATTVNTQTTTHQFYNFGFSVPSTGTITDVIVLANLRVDSTASRVRYGMELSRDGGSTWSTQKFTNQIGTTDEDVYWGGSPDDWTILPTPSQANDSSNFRIRIQNDFASASADAFLDYIAVKVCYVDSATPVAPDDTWRRGSFNVFFF